MSRLDWSILSGTFTGIVLPFAHSWMKSNVLPDWVKFIIAVTLSAIGGWLALIISGEYVNTLSIVQTASLIGSFGAGVYAVFFRQFGLERVLYPRAAVITEAQKSVAAQIGTIATQTIRDAIDPASETTISIQATPVTYLGSETSPVQPRG